MFLTGKEGYSIGNMYLCDKEFVPSCLREETKD